MTVFNDLQRKNLNEEMEKTVKITGLSKNQVKILLNNNTHSEIRKYMQDNGEPPPFYKVI
jgi:hypothetical protein